MSRPSYPRDRFDDLPQGRGKVGAHRVENPHLRGWTIFLWAALATVVLIVAGIFGTLVATGRITLESAPEPVVTPTPTIEAVVDTSYDVLVLNATTEDGLATRTKNTIVQAGWADSSVLASEAGTTDFPETTVFYLAPEDEAAAAGLAQVIGADRIEQSDVYQPADPEDRQLTVVLGADRVPTPEPES